MSEDGYDRKVVLAKGGTAERTVALHEITIPDLWHLAMNFPKGSKERNEILEVWHLAHDLKRNLAGDV